MAWQEPKTDWVTNPKNPMSEDFNRIEGNVDFLKTDIETKKGLIVDAISDMNQPALVTDTHAELANKIRSISSDANAATGDVEKGKTFYSGGTKKTGTLELMGTAATGDVLSGRTFYNNDLKAQRTGAMPNKGAVTITPGQTEQKIPAGYHNGSGKVPAVVFDASKVLTGTTIAGKTGTMPNRGKAIITPGTTNKPIVQGYHDGTGYVVGDADLVAANIKKGVNIFGVTGSLAEVPWFYDFSAYTTHFDHVFQALYVGESMTFLNLTGPGWLTWLHLRVANQHECTVIIDGVTRYFNGGSSTYGPIIAQPIYFQNSVVVTIKNSGTSMLDVNLTYTYMLRNTTPDVEKHTIRDAGGVYHKGLSGTLDISGSGYLLGYGRGGSWQSSTIKIDGVTFNLRTDYWIFITGPIRFTSQVYSPSVTGLQQVLYILD
jgi:hypothetical protein